MSSLKLTDLDDDVGATVDSFCFENFSFLFVSSFLNSAALVKAFSPVSDEFLQVLPCDSVLHCQHCNPDQLLLFSVDIVVCGNLRYLEQV